ncbi:MAG: RNA polymerase sigma factor [Candidatus Hydrogenedentes bacterium]|nr:RNA polymerase sigma factor [Candidatus Hydrogenedentota bacterium]
MCADLIGPLYGYALSLVGNRHLAEDLVQDTFMRLVNLMRDEKLRNRSGTVRSLVFTILHNLAIDRRRTAKLTVPLDDTIPARTDPSLEHAALRDEIDVALAQIPVNYREAIALREFGELSYDEIAKTLNATLPEVRTWIHRGRKQLATLLSHHQRYAAANEDRSS